MHWQPFVGNAAGVAALLALVVACAVGMAYVIRSLSGRSSRLLIGA